MTMKVEQGSIEALRKMIKDVKYALLTTASGDGTLHSRPLTTLDWAFDGVAWFLVARLIVSRLGRGRFDLAAQDEPDQVARHLQLSAGHRCVRHRVRMLDQGLDPAQGLAQNDH